MDFVREIFLEEEDGVFPIVEREKDWRRRGVTGPGGVG